MRLTLTSLAALSLAILAAWKLGGTLGAGVLMGFFLGAALCGLGVLYQRHLLLTRPERFMTGLVVSFAAKLCALFLGALAFRFIDAAAARVDWRGFLIAFAGAVAVILPVATIEALRDLGPRSKAKPDEVRS